MFLSDKREDEHHCKSSWMQPTMTRVAKDWSGESAQKGEGAISAERHCSSGSCSLVVVKLRKLRGKSKRVHAPTARATELSSDQPAVQSSNS